MGMARRQAQICNGSSSIPKVQLDDNHELSFSLLSGIHALYVHFGWHVCNMKAVGQYKTEESQNQGTSASDL